MGRKELYFFHQSSKITGYYVHLSFIPKIANKIKRTNLILKKIKVLFSVFKNHLLSAYHQLTYSILDQNLYFIYFLFNLDHLVSSMPIHHPKQESNISQVVGVKSEQDSERMTRKQANYVAINPVKRYTSVKWKSETFTTIM